MKISKEEVKYIAKLAKLSFTEEETEKFVMEFSDILTHFENIDREDVDGIDTNTLDKVQSVLRRDEVKPFDNRSELFKNVKNMRGTSIEIPKVIE